MDAASLDRLTTMRNRYFFQNLKIQMCEVKTSTTKGLIKASQKKHVLALEKYDQICKHT